MADDLVGRVPAWMKSLYARPLGSSSCCRGRLGARAPGGRWRRAHSWSGHHLLCDLIQLASACRLVVSRASASRKLSEYRRLP